MDHNFILVFKLFGNFSNILLYKDDRCINVFKHGTGDENKIILKELDRQITPFSETEDRISKSSIKARIPSFDKNILDYLTMHGLEACSDHQIRFKLVADVMSLLKNPRFYVHSEGAHIKFSILPVKSNSKAFSDPIEALNYFYSEYHRLFWLNIEKNRLIRFLRVQLKKTSNYIQKSNGKLENLRRAGDYRQSADIIMANLQNIQVGMDSVELFDFYNNKNIQIKLKENLSPQKNAENYYRKAKNQKLEVQSLERNIKQKSIQAAQITNFLDNISSINNLKELRLFAAANKLSHTKKEHKDDQPRFKMYEHMGFQILVGRNARNNDELTFKYGYKEDLWLHAKDVKGSHVLVKYQSGKNFPKPVITLAAQLAAHNSANKNSDTCPVIYTMKKFVRKSKGMPAGTVVLEKEDIIFVKPQNF
jgi:predicted ribosome quality control (RQC) complex YloA/Tae2 family protein